MICKCKQSNVHAWPKKRTVCKILIWFSFHSAIAACKHICGGSILWKEWFLCPRKERAPVLDLTYLSQETQWCMAHGDCTVQRGIIVLGAF